LVQLILNRLGPLVDMLKVEFLRSSNEVGVRYCVVVDLLPKEIASRISEVFPNPELMRLMSSFREIIYI
jgi:hypothetical protein